MRLLIRGGEIAFIFFFGAAHRILFKIICAEREETSQTNQRSANSDPHVGNHSPNAQQREKNANCHRGFECGVVSCAAGKRRAQRTKVFQPNGICDFHYLKV